MNRTFPLVKQLGEVPACFNCLGPTDPESYGPSGFAPGTGAFAVFCGKCELYTYFDVEPVAEKS